MTKYWIYVYVKGKHPYAYTPQHSSPKERKDKKVTLGC